MDLLYNDIIGWFKDDIRNEEWTTVYKSFDGIYSQINYYTILFPERLIEDFLEHSSWTANSKVFKPGYVHYYDKKPKYRRWGIEEDYEPIVFHQFFNNLYNSKEAIIEEFILFNNLIFEQKNKTYISVDISSEQNVVAKIIEEENNFEIQIRTLVLRKFLTAKNLIAGNQIEYFRFSNEKLSDYKNNDYKEEKGKDYHFTIDFQELKYYNDENRNLNSRLIGKKLLFGLKNIEILTDYEEFKKEEKCDFIVDIDIDSGRSIYENCNKSEIFNKNENYNYFTPVFFNREVLEKYYNNTSLYTVEDNNVLMKGSWRIEIDNNQEEYISAYLGDLQKLPYKEQLLWKSYNIPIKGKLSKRKLDIDFLTKWTPPKIIDLKFKNQYRTTNKYWKEKFGFDLFCELKEKDEHCLKSIRIPLRNEISELDTLILNLAKIMIDYLNVKDLNKYLKQNNIQFEQSIGSIEKMKLMLINVNCFETEDICLFLKNLQDIRSKGSAHRKSSDYEKSLSKMGLENKTEIDKFKYLLERANYILERLEVCTY